MTVISNHLKKSDVYKETAMFLINKIFFPPYGMTSIS